MTDSCSGSPRYDDDEFLSVLLVHHSQGDHWVGTAGVVRYLGCDMRTANRRLLELAREEPIEVYDPEEGDGEQVEPESFENPPRRLLGFRFEPVDPETAPDYLDTGAKIL